MHKIKVLKPFKFAHGGIKVEEFEPHPEGEPRECTQELIDHDGLEEEGYIEIVSGEKSKPVEDEVDDPEGGDGKKPTSVTTRTPPARKAATKKA